MGGTIAIRVAAVRPDLVRSLTLVSPALPERRPQRTAVPTGLLAIPGVDPALQPRDPRLGRGAAHLGAAGAHLR